MLKVNWVLGSVAEIVSEQKMPGKIDANQLLSKKHPPN